MKAQITQQEHLQLAERSCPIQKVNICKKKDEQHKYLMKFERLKLPGLDRGDRVLFGVTTDPLT